MAYPKIKLVSFPICPFVQRAALLMERAGIPYEVEFIDLAAKPDWFLKLSPLGKVPIMVVDDTVLFESNVLLEFVNDLAGTDLHPKEPLKKANHKALMEFAGVMGMAQFLMTMAPDEKSFQKRKTDLLQKMSYVESQLSNAPYFEGNTLHLIDFAFQPMLERLGIVKKYYMPEILDNFPKMEAWGVALHKAIPEYQRSHVENFEQTYINKVNDFAGVWADVHPSN